MNNLDRKEWIDQSVQQLLESWQLPPLQGLQTLKESVSYSFSQGGKRFRPVISLMLAEAFAVHPLKVLPWALSVEMIHTYSLIHDDLPCMDNDDFRRGEPTNHKVYGETTALLAGDALLTEAFGHLAKSYHKEPEVGLKLVGLLAQSAGLLGMVGGQAADLAFQKEQANFEDLKTMQDMKTGALIRVSLEGAAVICGLLPEKVQYCRQYGALLGFAFQLKDDLLDALEKQELCSFPSTIGTQQTQDLLEETSQQAMSCLQKLGIASGPLYETVQFNLDRKI
jgi:geranylgeranyl diphosphate synthase type II